jgi:hypothetical protein
VVATGSSMLPTSVMQEAFRDLYGKTLNFASFASAVDRVDRWYRSSGVLGQVGGRGRGSGGGLWGRGRGLAAVDTAAAGSGAGAAGCRGWGWGCEVQAPGGWVGWAGRGGGGGGRSWLGEQGRG